MEINPSLDKYGDPIYYCRHCNSSTICALMDTMCPQCWHNKHIAFKPKEYSYFITMTKKPDVRKETLIQNLTKLSRREALKILHLQYCLEHWNDDANPHIHIYMRTQRYFDKSRCKAYETAGKIQVVKAKGNIHEINEYMSKENEIIILISNNAQSIEKTETQVTLPTTGHGDQKTD